MTVTTFQKSTVGQIKANLNHPENRYHLVVILDGKDFNGFDAAKQFGENKLSSQFIMMIISSNDVKGNLLKCITMGIDHYIVKPFDMNDLYETIKSSFPLVGRKLLPVKRKRKEGKFRYWWLRTIK